MTAAAAAKFCLSLRRDLTDAEAVEFCQGALAKMGVRDGRQVSPRPRQDLTSAATVKFRRASRRNSVAAVAVEF